MNDQFGFIATYGPIEHIARSFYNYFVITQAIHYFFNLLATNAIEMERYLLSNPVFNPRSCHRFISYKTWRPSRHLR